MIFSNEKCCTSEIINQKLLHNIKEKKILGYSYHILQLGF